MNRFPAVGFRLLLALSAVAASGPSARAAIIWDEGADGDLSNTQASPTVITLGPGTNSVIGTVGGGDRQDWVTIHVPAGMVLGSVVLQSYVSTDRQGFLGFQHGTVFVGSPFSAASYAGYAHFGTGATNGTLPPTNLVGVDLLPLMADPAVAPGSLGFAVPLPGGDYAFLIQQTGAAATGYQFDFVTVSVPEPPSAGLLVVLCAAVLIPRAGRPAHRAG